MLPARLKDEMAALEQAILDGAEIREDEVLAKHADWWRNFCLSMDLQQEVVWKVRLHRKNYMRSFRQKSVLCSRKFYWTQVFTSAQRKAERHSVSLWIPLMHKNTGEYF